jgi:hypothetical protein
VLSTAAGQGDKRCLSPQVGRCGSVSAHVGSHLCTGLTSCCLSNRRLARLPQYAEGETAPDHQIWAIGGLLAIPIWSVKGQVARCTEFARYCRIADVAWVHAYALVGMFTRRLRADWKAPATNRHFSIVIRIQARRSPHIGHAQIGPLWGNSHLAGPTFLGLVGARSHKGGVRLAGPRHRAASR